MKNVRVTTFCALAVSLALLLSGFKIFRLPQGGGISLESVPILFIGLWLGAGAGILTGVVFGFLHGLLQGGALLHPAQFLLDYPLAYGALGFSGLSGGRRLTPLRGALGVLLGMGGRFACHLLSGVLFIRLFAPQAASHPWKYSLLYNASFLLPQLVFTWLIAVPLALRMRRREGAA